MVANSKRKFLIPRDIAEQLGVNVSRVHSWINNGELIAANVSDSKTRPRWRVRPEDFEKFFEARSSNSGNASKATRQKPTAAKYV